MVLAMYGTIDALRANAVLMIKPPVGHIASELLSWS